MHHMEKMTQLYHLQQRIKGLNELVLPHRQFEAVYDVGSCTLLQFHHAVGVCYESVLARTL